MYEWMERNKYKRYKDVLYMSSDTMNIKCIHTLKVNKVKEVSSKLKRFYMTIGQLPVYDKKIRIRSWSQLVLHRGSLRSELFLVLQW